MLQSLGAVLAAAATKSSKILFRKVVEIFSTFVGDRESIRNLRNQRHGVGFRLIRVVEVSKSSRLRK